MTSISDIRAALAAQIGTIPGLRPEGIVPGQVSPPVALVRPARGVFATYFETFDGGCNLAFEVFLLVSVAIDREAQQQLDAYLSPTGTQSVLACLQKNPALGGVVSSAALTAAESYGNVEYAGTTYLGAILTIETLAP